MSDVNPCISRDIWFEILKELPVKTLGKCRCVCKSWHSLIVSPSFMAAHLQHYTRNDANSLLLCKEISKRSKTEKFEQCIFFRDVVQLKLGNRLHTSICPFVVPRNWFSPCFYFVGSVYGLLCVSDSEFLSPRDPIWIWNPLIQKSIKLPKSLTDLEFVVGFGYDCRKNDHRVVKISFSATKMPFLVEVYSVQERSWRPIFAKYLVDNSINWVSSSHCFMNGVIHWRARGKWMLLFNVSEETFAKMELPEELVNRCIGDFGLFEYKGKLSVSHCGTMSCGTDVSAYCQIWVKRDYNVDTSWYKILFVEMLHDVYSIGTFEYLGKNEELLGFALQDGEELVSYDPKTKQITKLGLRASRSTKFSAFSESLALLDQKIDDDEHERSVANCRHYLDHWFGDSTDNEDEVD